MVDELGEALARLREHSKQEYLENVRWFVRHYRRGIIMHSVLFALNAGFAVMNIVLVKPLGLLNVVAAVLSWHCARNSLVEYRRFKQLL